MYILKIFLIYFLNINFTECFHLSHFEPAVGKWRLLYDNNKNLNYQNIEIQIIPSKNEINELYVKIKRYEKNNFVTYTKIISCNAINQPCEEFDNCDLEESQICSLIIFKTEKYVKSIAIFEFPYLAIDYISGMNPKYNIKWKVNIDLNRLYIKLDDNTYVFEKKILEKKDYNNDDNVITNVFLITNLLSFFVGKFLEKTLHIS
jgi:hypothetical protein